METHWFYREIPVTNGLTKEAGFLDSSYQGQYAPTLPEMKDVLDDIQKVADQGDWEIKGVFPIMATAYFGASKVNESYIPFTRGVAVLMQRPSPGGSKA